MIDALVRACCTQHDIAKHKAADTGGTCCASAKRSTTTVNAGGLAATVSLAVLPQAMAYEVNDQLSIRGGLSGAYQYEFVGSSFRDQGEGALAFQPELSFRPTPIDEVFFKVGFAADNALNDKTPFSLAPWAADLEEDVKNINDRDRDYPSPFGISTCSSSMKATTSA